MDCLVRSHGSRHGMVGSKSIPQPRGLRCRFALSPDQHADSWLGGWWTLPPVSKSPSHSFGNQYVRLMQHNRSLIRRSIGTNPCRVYFPSGRTKNGCAQSVSRSKGQRRIGPPGKVKAGRNRRTKVSPTTSSCRRLSFGFPSALDAQPIATEDWPVVVVCLQDFCWRGLQRNRAPSPVIAVIGEGFCHRSQTTAIRIDGYDF